MLYFILEQEIENDTFCIQQKPQAWGLQFTTCSKYWFSIINVSKYRYTYALLLLSDILKP